MSGTRATGRPLGRPLGLALVATATLAWSTAGLFTRAIQESLPAVLVWRGLFGTLGMVVVLLAVQGPAGFRDFARLGRGGWAYALTATASLLCYISALRMTSIAHVAIIYATVPFLTAGLAWALAKEKPGRSAVVASGLAFLGALVMVGLGREGTVLGDLLALAMTLGMALMMVIARRDPTIPTMPAGMVSTAASVLIALPLGGAVWPAGDQLTLLAGFGIANSTLGFTLFLIGSRHIPAIETALLGAMEAPIAPLWVWLVFGERPVPATLAGGAIVLAAVLGHILHQARSGAA